MTTQGARCRRLGNRNPRLWLEQGRFPVVRGNPGGGINGIDESVADSSCVLRYEQEED